MEKYTVRDIIKHVARFGANDIHLDWEEYLNTKVRGINKSRYIASWLNIEGPMDHRFRAWLDSLLIDGEHLTREEIDEICDFAENGKFELQEDAKRFLDCAGVK